MNAIKGTRPLLRLALRRERTIAPWWILLLAAMSLIMVGYIERAMGTPELMAEYTSMINRNSFFRALGGAFTVPDLGYMAAWRSGGFLYLLNGLAAMLTVIRYTRADEETGRTELLRAGVVSRYAGLTTAVLVAGGVALAGGVLPALALIAKGLDPAGSIAYGLAIVSAGWVFGAITAVGVQLARSARTARNISLSVLGIAYVLRYAGDASGQYWLKYLSPLGWSHLVLPYLDNRWWMLTLPVVVTAILLAVAYRLLSHRDLGEGFIPERLGPATAPGLRGPVRLSWRLHRGLLVSWAAAMACFAVAASGAMTLVDQLEDTPTELAMKLVEGFGGSPGATYIDNGVWALILIAAYVLALYPVLMIQRLRADEASGRVEVLHATPMTRLRWAAGHLLVTALGTAALFAITGLVFGVGFALAHGGPSDIPRLFAGALGAIPAAWLVGAVAMLGYGLLPRAAVAASWIVWIGTIVLGRIAGPLYGRWGGTPVEPFHFIPNTVAGDPFDPVPAVTMLVLSAICVGAGLFALRRRDMG